MLNNRNDVEVTTFWPQDKMHQPEISSAQDRTFQLELLMSRTLCCMDMAVLHWEDMHVL